MPARCSSAQSSRPEGPAPTMATWVRMLVSVSDRCWRGERRRGGRGAQWTEWAVRLDNSNMTRKDRPRLPAYALYGEAGRAPAVDPLHCESIAARSRLHDWEIRPHRHESLCQVLIVERGRAEAA